MEMIFVVMIVVQAVLLGKAFSLNRILKARYEEQDGQLARYVADNLDMEKRLSDMRDDYEKQQQTTEEMRRIQQQIGLLKHDMKNHTMVILSYLEENKTEDAKRYAGEILDKLNRTYTYVHVGNSLLSHILNTKLSKAKEEGIGIKAEIENLPFSYMDSVDFSSLLNNMLDNAISGALGSKERKLEVNIASKKGFDILTVKNSIDGSVLQDNPQLISSKEEPGHGYGMKQMRTVAEKYDGTMDLYEQDGMFIVTVMFA